VELCLIELTEIMHVIRTILSIQQTHVPAYIVDPNQPLELGFGDARARRIFTAWHTIGKLCNFAMHQLTSGYCVLLSTTKHSSTILAAAGLKG